MDPIILAAIIAAGVLFLFVLAAKLAWFVQKMGEDPGSQNAAQPQDLASTAGMQPEQDTSAGRQDAGSD